MVPPLITLEEHFLSEAIHNSSTKLSRYEEQLKHIPGLTEKLTDIGPLRLSQMDTSKISLQVISHAPGTKTPDQCRQANTQLHAACLANPKRFAGFAVLPVADPDDMSKELAYCVEELGFVGALIDNHTDTGVTFEGPEYTGFWYTVQSLGVPVYLHPTWPTDEMRDVMYGGKSPAVPESVVSSISASGFGWHSSVALHVLKLFGAGVFDKFPKLKIIIGHMGEMLPFMLQRVGMLSLRWGDRKRDFKTVWDENIWITTSGVWSLDPLRCILADGNTKIERVLFSVDYPFAKNEDGLKWVQDLEKSDIVDEEGLAKICYLNAQKLLGVRVWQDNDHDEAVQTEDGAMNELDQTIQVARDPNFDPDD